VSYSSGTETRSWQIYRVRDSALVAPLGFDPVVVDGLHSKKAWLDASVAWYQDATRWDIPIADDGPSSWERVARPDDPPTPKAVRRAVVRNITTGDDHLSFDVDKPGTPVVVRTSYFPNWKATGADGPYRISPNLMVVVPTSTHVRLYYGWTGVDLAGWALTGLGAVLALFLARRRAVRLPAPPPPPPAAHVDPFAVEPTGRLDGALDADPVPATTTVT
jgi:hypothetical protein